MYEKYEGDLLKDRGLCQKLSPGQIFIVQFRDERLKIT